MSESEKEFLKRLLATFRIEADEYIKSISTGLVKLENTRDPEDRTRLLDNIYRQAHSFKGSARAVDLSGAESICQLLESIFKNFKNRGVPEKPEVFDILQNALDTVENLIDGRELDIEPVLRALEEVEQGRVPKIRPEPKTTVPSPARPSDKNRRFTRGGIVSSPSGKTENSSSAAFPDPIKTPEISEVITPKRSTIRVDSEKLDHLLLQAEEMIAMKLSINRRISQMEESLVLVETLKKERHRATAGFRTAGKREEFVTGGQKKIKDFLDIGYHQLKELGTRLNQAVQTMQADERLFGSMIDSHLDDLRKILMLPFLTLIESFPRMVRDMARQKDKDVELEMKGGEIEIDRRILEEIKDPLIHLLRNAVDHGIETPQERQRLGKSSRARIRLEISREENNRVQVEVSDNGSGIMLEKVKQKIVDSNVHSPEEIKRMPRGEILSFIFNPEFSTSPIVTELSGRGLGLAIVCEKIEKLGGHISVDSAAGEGSRFLLLLQTTLSTFRGILAGCGGRKWVIPTMHVEQAVRIPRENIKTVENREIVRWGDKVLSYVRLHEVLGLPDATGTGSLKDTQDAVILTAGDKHIAFQVDDVLDEHEVLVKELGKQLTRVRNIAGATILGSGEVVPVLNVADLIQSSIAFSSTGAVKTVRTAVSAAKTRTVKKILVAEDSITSRMLLKNILQSAGYQVRVAVDGQDGWLLLNEENFDLAVLDVEMPRMTGFELTAKIRGNRNLEHLPVILVTSLESREDREKGIDAGADAYIVKSSFDQSNLIEVIKKLV